MTADDQPLLDNDDDLHDDDLHDDDLHDDDLHDEGLPVFLPSRSGRTISARGLLERIMEQFNDEFGKGSAAWLEANTPTKKRSLVKDVVEYVVSVESVILSLKEKAEMMQLAYSELCGFSGLDPFFVHADVTSILIEGVEKLSIRYEAGSEIEHALPVFDDHKHLMQVVKRLLEAANAEADPDTPIIETGFRLNNRPISLNVVFPPFVSELTADIRVHPVTLPTLDDLEARGFINALARDTLEALARSEHGFLIVGDTESGKTTLLAVLSHLLNAPSLVSVERAGELRLPAGAIQKSVQWRTATQDGIGFAERVLEALELSPSCILLDEVRTDEAEAIAPLLAMDAPPRQIWTFRGTSDPKRMRSALSMTARVADKSQPEAMVNALYQRLPFMVTVKRRKGSIGLLEIAEWQYKNEEYPDYVELLRFDSETREIKRTGNTPMRPLAF